MALREEDLDNRIKQYTSMIKAHTSEGRYQTRPDLNELYQEIESEINKKPSQNYIERLTELKRKIYNIQKNKRG